MTRQTTSTRPHPVVATGLLGFAAILLTSCVTPTPRPELELETPESWRGVPVRDASVAPPATRWWASFQDTALESLIDEALNANHDLEAAAARVDAAVAQARIAGAARKPTASIGADSSRRRQNFIGLPIPGSESGVLSSTTTSFGAQLNVSWEIDLWGRLGAGARAAAEEVRAAEADYRAASLSLAGQTAKAWFALVEATAQVELGERIVGGRRSTRERIQRRFDLGLRNALDLRLAVANEAQAEADLTARRRQRDVAARQLETLLARYPAGALAAGEELPSIPPPIDGGVPSDLLVRRPDLDAADRRLSAAGFRIDAARAALYPQLTLSGSAGRTSDSFSDLADSDFSVWSLAAGLLQPVFQGGRLRANVELSEANQRAALEGYRQTILRAFAEVENALAAEGYLADQLQAQGAAAESAVASAELAERRYVSGLSDYLTVLTSQITSQQAQSQLLSVRRQRLDARVDLILALGGGWKPAGHEASATATVQEASR